MSARAITPVMLCAYLACGGRGAEVSVHLTATHPRPAEAREVWSSRFQSARDHDLLAITAAAAKLEPPGLVLDARVRVTDCDPARVEEVKAALVNLTTTRHALGVHRADPVAAEKYATRFRELYDVDVHTPVDKPGQLIVTGRAPDGDDPALVVESRSGDRVVMWAIDPVPALDGRGVATAAADVDSNGAAIALTFTEAGTAAMAGLSDSELGRYLVFVVDGGFALAPRVMARVNRSLRLELPAADATRALGLARAIAASNLAEPPVLVDLTATCATP